ncbi:MAG: hypothetical protein R2785_04570 [Flavobacteriaceae bacterium]
MNSRLIKISKNKIYFTNKFWIGLNQTNFPEGSISFRHHLDTYLKVELLHYDILKKTLELKILDYNPKNTASFNSQKLKRSINEIIFRELEWDKLQKLLSHFLNSLPKKMPEAFIKESLEKEKAEVYTEIELKPEIKQEIIQKEPLEIILEINFDANFSDAQFHNGYVSLVKNFGFLEQPIEFKIINEFIRSEYNYIKDYFFNYFKSDTFTISATIKTKGKELLSYDCQSKTIQNINETIIDNIKSNRTLNISRIEKDNETEKSTFTADEILSKLDGSLNVFKQTEFDILMTLIELKSPRNVRQLVYLSGKKHNKNKKIRFTLNPLFGFIFFISGNNKNHICWELLNSHATYIWSFDKELSIESQIELSELNINTIKKIGRKKYRSSIKNNQIDTNSAFSVINHSKSRSVNAFEIWKNKFENKVV